MTKNLKISKPYVHNITIIFVSVLVATSCPGNRVLQANGDACLPTCERPEPSESCLFPKTEVCGCENPLHIVNDAGNCVSAETCGCDNKTRQVRHHKGMNE